MERNENETIWKRIRLNGAFDDADEIIQPFTRAVLQLTLVNFWYYKVFDANFNL